MSAAVPLLDAYRAAGAMTGEVYGREAGLVLAGTGRGPWLADLGMLPKWLLLGSEATAALADAGLAVPALMHVAAGEAGAFVAARAPRQYLVSGGDRGVPPASLQSAACALRYDCVDLALGGGHGSESVEDLLAEACSCDLTEVTGERWMPTLCFGIEVALWRCAARTWRLIAAPADGEFLASTLLDAVRSRHGGLIGYRDFFDGQPQE